MLNNIQKILILTLLLPTCVFACAPTYHAYKDCVGNNIYWFSGCGQQQDLYQSCYGGRICQYGQCVAYVAPVYPVQPTYNPYYKTGCYNDSIYWYDSLGVISGLYRSCNDNDPCTQDACSNSKCVNTAIPNCPALLPEQANQTQQTIPVETSFGNQSQNQNQNHNNQNLETAAVSSVPVTSGFLEWFGRWYFWIITGLVLIFLFVIVYKRFSSEV